MPPTLKRTAVFALLLAGSLLPAADAPAPRWRQLLEAEQKAVKEKDWSELRRVLLELRPLIAGNPRITYNLAAAEAQLGHRDAAFGYLRELAATHLYYDIATDTDFAPIQDTPQFKAAVGALQENRKPVRHSEHAFALPGQDAIPEDLAYDSRTRRFFYSSVRKAQVFTADGKVFAATPWSAMALAIDIKRRLLWVSTAWTPHCESCKAADKDRTALVAFDLDSGAQKQRVDSPLKGLLGDMTISRNGDLYVSEGIYGAVLKLSAGGTQLERLDTEGEFPSPQTPTLSANESTLYVADYLRGIGALNLSTRKVEWMQPGPGIALNGIDGLYRHGDSFIAVQNGTTLARVIRFSMDLRQQEVLDGNSPGLGEPTHGVIVDNTFYFTVNTGWADYDGNGRKKAGTAPVESSVRKIPLGAPGRKSAD